MTLLKINRDFFNEALSTTIDSLFGEGWFLDTETGDVLLHSDGADDYPEDFPDSDRYIHIDSIPTSVAFEIMADFARQLDDAELSQSLGAILKRSKPFRGFKDFLYENQPLDEAWNAFEQKELSRIADQWCEENDIKAEWIL